MSFPLATLELCAISAYHKSQQHLIPFNRKPKVEFPHEKHSIHSIYLGLVTPQEEIIPDNKCYITENVLGVKLFLLWKPGQSDSNKMSWVNHYNVIIMCRSNGNAHYSRYDMWFPTNIFSFQLNLTIRSNWG